MTSCYELVIHHSRWLFLPTVTPSRQTKKGATHVNQKWVCFPVNMPLCYQICVAKCPYSDRDDPLENLFKNHRPRWQKVHFRLTFIAQKRRYLNSLLLLSRWLDADVPLPCFLGVRLGRQYTTLFQKLVITTNVPNVTRAPNVTWRYLHLHFRCNSHSM